MHCRLVLKHPPEFRLELRLADDNFYNSSSAPGWRSRCRWQSCSTRSVAGRLLIWGVCVRVAVCVTGHWLIGHYAHRQGPQTWVIDGASAQGYNVPLAGFISMGEAWHNNHHA